MKQYEFKAVSKQDGSTHTIRCTAPKQDWAKAQVQLAYRCFDICECVAEHKPHYFVGEIDGEDMKQEDHDYALRQLEKIA